MQPLAALYPTLRLSPWRQVWKNIHSTQEGNPSWFPLVPSDWGIWASSPETDQDSCPGKLPLVPLDLVSSQEGFSPSPLSPRFKGFPATRILPITFCVFSVWYLA